MSPEVRAAWLNAGDWVAAHWTGLAALAVAAAVLLVLCWAFRGDDYRTRNDRRQAAWLTVCEGRPEPGEPGSNDGLYLDCVAIYDDCHDLDRLRAIDQHRKEK